MKKRMITIAVALLAAMLTFGVCVTAMAEERSASGAETRPLFNYFTKSDSPFSYDTETGVYTASVPGGDLPRLTAIDAETLIQKTDYSDDLIAFSYRYTEIYDTPLDASDWYMYFTFRNLEGEAPCWASQYSAHILFFRDKIRFQLNYNGEPKILQEKSYPSLIDSEYNLVDDEFHTIEICIDDETGDLSVFRDKNTDGEISIEVGCYLEERNRIGLLAEGGYSFSFRKCAAEIKDVYFFNSKNEEADDEVARYEELLNAPGDDDDEKDFEAEDGKEEKKGCKSAVFGESAMAAFALTSLGGIVLCKEKR